MLTSEGRRSIKAPFTSARNLKYARIYKCTQRVCFYKTNPRLVRLDDADVATQLKFGLPADPYPTAELLARMRSGHGDKSRGSGGIMMCSAQQLSWTKRTAWCYTTAGCGGRTGGGVRFRDENRGAYQPALLQALDRTARGDARY